jgi:hypothetical protein
MKKEKYMKGWKVGQPMTYSEIDRLIEMVKDNVFEPEYDEEIAQRISEAHELAKRKAGKLDRDDTK